MRQSYDDLGLSKNNIRTIIKAVASSAMRKMHGIRAQASMWWNKRRRSSTENASHVEEAASNDGGQQKEEIGALEAPAPREDQPAASSMPAAEKGIYYFLVVLAPFVFHLVPFGRQWVR